MDTNLNTDPQGTLECHSAKAEMSTVGLEIGLIPVQTSESL